MRLSRPKRIDTPMLPAGSSANSSERVAPAATVPIVPGRRWFAA
jgi:hypothetical protein